MATDRHQAPSYPLRMPDDLKARVANSAQANNRSLHAELLVRLEESFRLNQADVDVTGAGMRLAESKVRESQYMGHALHLSNCVDFLLQAIRGPNPKGVIAAFPDLLEIAESSAADAKPYQVELNPRLRLKEYEEAIEKAEGLLQNWRPSMLPWPGSPEEEAGDAAPLPKRRRAAKPTKR